MKKENIIVTAAEIGADGVWHKLNLELKDAREISVKFEGDFKAVSGEAILRVFDESGVLNERIKLNEVAKKQFWTEFSPGERVSLEIDAAQSAAGKITVSLLATSPQGTSDFVTDGKPQFLRPSDANIPDLPRKATARLIVGQQATFPLGTALPSKTPDWCSGFLVSKNLLMTASHCVRRSSITCDQTVAMFGYEFRFPDGDVAARRCTNIVYLNPYIDVAVLALAPTPNEASFVALRTDAPKADEPLSVVQYPYGSVQLVSNDQACHVQKPSVSIEPSRIEIQRAKLTGLGFSHGCDTLNGSSGAPVFDSSNEVVGIHQGGVAGSNLAIRMDVVLSCISIDPAKDNLTVLQPGELICKNIN
ncbi:trypsin-like serine peptidase [Rhizobium leguminosarum]|uniref:trypsin-like serine peptidase n=1 Tax=Rhizobium leguminosarum TaxID=384 RepID=UPI001C94A133|nr:serine protease [Rhizobium leguminosarum]MBY5326526.1 trypsin-like peptidase domain-containing protein [Rhizobium leguminosarum]